MNRESLKRFSPLLSSLCMWSNIGAKRCRAELECSAAAQLNLARYRSDLTAMNSGWIYNESQSAGQVRCLGTRVGGSPSVGSFGTTQEPTSTPQESQHPCY